MKRRRHSVADSIAQEDASMALSSECNLHPVSFVVIWVS